MTAVRFFSLFFLALGGVAQAAPALPSPEAAGATPAPSFETRIAAVVNDGVITLGDLDSRIKMVMLSSNLPDTPEMEKRLAPQVLRTLIDEQLEMQAAKRHHITATQDELRKALDAIEAQNHMKAGALVKFLTAHGIEKGALVDQLTASIEWVKLVQQRALEGNPISGEEIDHEMKRLSEHANEPESRVAEIFLPVDRPGRGAEVRQLAQRLVAQMRQGARFSAIAQQFSQSPTAAVGGDMGWLRPQQLPAELGKAVAGMQPGELSPPIRTADGYYLLLLLDRRSRAIASEQNTILDIVQVAFPLPLGATDAMKKAAIAEAESVRAAATSCPEFLKIGKARAPRLSSEGRLRLTQIAPAVRHMLLSLPIGTPSPPILQKNGVGVLMVCHKSVPKEATLNRKEVANTLLRQRLDIVARQYLRKLRRAAFVDVRG
jgi:peptidyl-prolyl cis-trans isomerase SurA